MTRSQSAIAAEDCPRIELHTAAPTGYLQWHAWAERMSKTHRQERCPGCNLFTIWVPRKKRTSV